MAEDEEPTQETQQGHEIPVPKKGDVFGAFRRIAKGGKQNGKAGKSDKGD